MTTEQNTAVSHCYQIGQRVFDMSDPDGIVGIIEERSYSVDMSDSNSRARCMYRVLFLDGRDIKLEEQQLRAVLS